MLEIRKFVERHQTKVVSPSWKKALGYLVILAFAETLNMLSMPRAGLILHGLILLILLLQASLNFRKQENRFLIILALVPLIRLLSLTLPLKYFPPIYWFVVVGVPLSIAAFLGARFTGLKGNMIGLRLSCRAIPSQVLIGLMGLGFGLIEYLILQPDPLLTELRWDSVWLPILILLIFTGLLEEIIFRGMLQSTASQYLGRWGVPYAALVFAVLHFGYRSALNVLFVLAVALLFGSVVQRRGTLLGVSIAHGLTNVSLFLVYPFLFANPGIGVSPPAELLLPLVPTPTPFQVISPTPEATATLSMPSPTLNIPASNLLEKGDHDSTKISTLLPTFSLTKCGSPPGWVGYAVQAGDTLWGISLRTGEKVEVLRKANCLDNAALIYIGQRLSVPHILLDATPSPTSTAAPPTQIPTLPPTQIPKPTSEPSSTPTEPIPSLTPRNTPTLAPTSLPSGEG